MLNRRIVVLIADDHKVVRQGIKLILSHQDDLEFECYEAENGKVAINKIRKIKIDIVLLDINMPDKNGIEVARILMQTNPSCKVIALSMHSEQYIVDKMLEAGVSGYLLKDAGEEELLCAIKTVLNGNKFFSNEIALKLMGEFDHKVREDYNRDKPETDKISKRELEILKLIADEFTNEEIAKELNISKRTVDSHRQKILIKLQVKNTAGLIRYALKNYLLE